MGKRGSGWDPAGDHGLEKRVEFIDAENVGSEGGSTPGQLLGSSRVIRCVERLLGEHGREQKQRVWGAQSVAGYPAHALIPGHLWP